MKEATIKNHGWPLTFYEDGEVSVDVEDYEKDKLVRSMRGEDTSLVELLIEAWPIVLEMTEDTEAMDDYKEAIRGKATRWDDRAFSRVEKKFGIEEVLYLIATALEELVREKDERAYPVARLHAALEKPFSMEADVEISEYENDFGGGEGYVVKEYTAYLRVPTEPTVRYGPQDTVTLAEWKGVVESRFCSAMLDVCYEGTDEMIGAGMDDLGFDDYTKGLLEAFGQPTQFNEYDPDAPELYTPEESTDGELLSAFP